MAKGIALNNVDFDELFDQDVKGDGPASTMLFVNGVPLRYAKLSHGSKRPDVGYVEGNIDVANLWAAKGTARYTLPFDGQTFSAERASRTSASGQVSAAVQLSMNSNGTFEIVAIETGGGLADETRSLMTGSWLPAGHNAGDYIVAFTVHNLGQAVGTNGAPSPSSLSTSRAVSAVLRTMAGGGLDLYEAPFVDVLLTKSGEAGVVSTFTMSLHVTGWR